MSEVAALEYNLEQYKELSALRDAAVRLHSNPDFKKLILDKFMVQECARYAHTSADPSMSAESRQDALAMAQASGHLKRYLSVVVQMGNGAAGQISDLEARIEEARIEGGE
jgi:hypothetical protein